MPSQLVLLEPAVRHYAWGSRTALPALLGVEPGMEPVAELWFGAHPAGPACVRADGGTIPLDEYVAADTVRMLGPAVAESFGRLPFMVKLIAADQPLSIQVHPSGERARDRYGNEGDREPRYLDPFAKPEILCALGSFDALIDFRAPVDVAADLDAAGLSELAETVRVHGLEAALRQVLALDRVAARGAIVALAAGGDQLVKHLAALYPDDPGVVIATFLNRIRLQAGDAAFLGPGTVHAYLGGTAVEIMSTSDNVLRAGLTSKLIDVDEFLAVARCESGQPDLLVADATGTYPRRAEEFDAARYGGGEARALRGPAIVVATRGAIDVGGRTLAQGRGAFVPAAAGTVMLMGAGEAYVATANW